MQYPVVVFPDAVGVVIEYLTGAVAQPVLPRVPNPRPPVFLVVQRSGGPRRDLVTDNAMITVEAWALDDGAAHDLARQARALLHAMPGPHPGTTVYRVTEAAGPQFSPDPDSYTPRYVFTVLVALRGTELAS